MLEVSELSLRLLAELEEAQQQTITSLLNTVITPTGNSVELTLYREACLGLISGGHVRVAVAFDENRRLKDESLAESVDLLNFYTSHFIFDGNQGLWLISDKAVLPRTASFPNLVLTEVGLSQAIAVLEERGYRWWVMPDQRK
jgi:hypothetical protein